MKLMELTEELENICKDIFEKNLDKNIRNKKLKEFFNYIKIQTNDVGLFIYKIDYKNCIDYYMFRFYITKYKKIIIRMGVPIKLMYSKKENIISIDNTNKFPYRYKNSRKVSKIINGDKTNIMKLIEYINNKCNEYYINVIYTNIEKANKDKLILQSLSI